MVKVATFYDTAGEIVAQVPLLKGNESLDLPPGAVRIEVSGLIFEDWGGVPGLRMATMKGRWLRPASR